MKNDGVGGAWSADSIEEITREGWRVLQKEKWKPGVMRVHCVKRNEFRMVYVSTCRSSVLLAWVPRLAMYAPGSDGHGAEAGAL